MCLSVLLIVVVGGPRDLARAQEHKEYDFDLSKGLYLYNQGQYREAERHLKDALSARPGDPTT